MNHIKAIVFDMDGVILDTETMVDKSWIIAAKEFNLPQIQDAMIACLGTNKNDTLDILNKKYGHLCNPQDFLSRASELFHKLEFEEGIALMPYAKECLEYLKPKYRIALASSTRNELVIRQLKNANVLEFFEEIVTGDMVLHSKPDPEIYLKACKGLGVMPQNAIAVEDSFNGIRSAFNAGMMPVMIPDTVMPDEEITELLFKKFNNLLELIEFLKN
jgi:HAD superfamily hydrolase (TIGR01509 family)